MDKVDCIVIGAGVVGLAVARALAHAGREVLVLEANPAIGMETSSRNSEVIHAGLYYPAGSLKARLCVAGRDALYAYCNERGIAHHRCGKLIVSTSEAQQNKLKAIHAQAHANGCSEVFALSGEQAKSLEPALSCTAALHSPLTGVIDSHGFMLALHGDAENAGAMFAFNSRVLGARAFAGGIALQVQSGPDASGCMELETKMLVNCAGLWACGLAAKIEGLDGATIPASHFAKGSYYSLIGKAPFSRLIYPIPEDGGLGVHLTLDLGGQARFGPDVEWLDNFGDIPDYSVDPKRSEKFYGQIRAYWRELPDNALQPAYAGIRPKLSGPGENAADFLFANHGNAAYLELYGIESPGLTASLAIADHVALLVQPSR